MSKTMNNLAAAFAGESQANRKYLAFAKKAEQDGLPQVAKLFRAAANAETIHAHAHLKLMGGIGTTEENLKEAIGGETHEFTDMYPQMMKDAESEGNAKALQYFGFANQAEEVHAQLYSKALQDPAGLMECDYYICTICGHTIEGAPEANCPICGALPKAYVISE